MTSMPAPAPSPRPDPAAPAPASDAPRTVLHVGCGHPLPHKLYASFRHPGWREVRLDINPAVKPDIVASMTDMGSVPDGSMDAVWSSHNLEHLYAHEVPVALAEFVRVLKADGFLLITMPDVQKVAEMVAQSGDLTAPLYESPAGPISALDVLYGFGKRIAEGNTFMAHRTGFTAKSLASAFRDAGFGSGQVWRRNFDLWGVGFKSVVAPSDPRLQSLVSGKTL